MATPAAGLMRVKDEPGEAKPAAASHTVAVMPSWNPEVSGVVPTTDRPLAAVHPLVSAGGGGGGGIVGGSTPSHPMFGAFPAGFFNAAAFAAAAAAAFPGMATATNNNTCTSNNNKSKPNLLGPATPSNKRRKRGRAQQEEDGNQQHEKATTVASTAGTPAAAVASPGTHQGGPLLAKLEALSPDRKTSPPPLPSSVVDVGPGTGGGWSPGAVAPMNVLTPNLFEGEMSNQERKERRKIRNRMSAQQHRERQRQRVDTLEDLMKKKDDEIVKLKGQVASLTEKNKRLTSRVLQLEAGECPDLEAILRGLEDESESRSDSSAMPVTVAGGEGGALRRGEDTDGGGVTTDQAHSSSESDSDDLSPLSTLDGRLGQPCTPPLSPARCPVGTPTISLDGVGARTISSEVDVALSAVGDNNDDHDGNENDCSNNMNDHGYNNGHNNDPDNNKNDHNSNNSNDHASSSPSPMEFSVSRFLLAGQTSDTSNNNSCSCRRPVPVVGDNGGQEFSTAGLLSDEMGFDNTVGVAAVSPPPAPAAEGLGQGTMSVEKEKEVKNGDWSVLGNGAIMAAPLCGMGGDDHVDDDGDAGSRMEDDLTMAALDPMEIDALLEFAGDGIGVGIGIGHRCCANDHSGGYRGGGPSGHHGGVGSNDNHSVGSNDHQGIGCNGHVGVGSNDHRGGDGYNDHQGVGSNDRRGDGFNDHRGVGCNDHVGVVARVGGGSTPYELEEGGGGGGGGDSGAGSSGMGNGERKGGDTVNLRGQQLPLLPSRTPPPPVAVAGGAAQRVTRSTRGRSGADSTASTGGIIGGGGSGTGGGSGRGVASTVAAGVMGALCLAGVVINSGQRRRGSMQGTELVVAPVHGHATGRRVLSSAVEQEDQDEAEYVNVTDTEPWVFHPVEAEPWRWRTTAAREGRAPWVWERALDIFGDAGLGASDSRHDVACHDEEEPGGAGGARGVELVRSDDAARRRYGKVGMEVYPPPIIAPPNGNGHEDGDGDEPSEFSGKELDFYHSSPSFGSWPANGGDSSDPGGGLGRGDGGGGGVGRGGRGRGHVGGTMGGGGAGVT